MFLGSKYSHSPTHRQHPLLVFRLIARHFSMLMFYSIGLLVTVEQILFFLHLLIDFFVGSSITLHFPVWFLGTFKNIEKRSVYKTRSNRYINPPSETPNWNLWLVCLIQNESQIYMVSKECYIYVCLLSDYLDLKTTELLSWYGGCFFNKVWPQMIILSRRLFESRFISWPQNM